MYLEKFRLDGRVAFVTGGAQGIGRSCADALTEAGATVITGDLKGADVTLDVTDSAAVSAVADELAASTAASIFSSTIPASRVAKLLQRTSRTSIGSTCWTSISTGRSGARAPSAGTCSLRVAERSLTSDR